MPPIELIYDQGLQAAGFPSPALRVAIGETSGWLLIDTGAGVHTLAAWFVDEAGVPMSGATASAKDSTGHDVTMRTAHDIELKLAAGPRLVLEEAAVADFPPSFREMRIGGLLSPQLLARQGMRVSLDLRAPSLKVVADKSAASAGTSPRAKDNIVCRSENSAFRNLLFGVNTTIAGTPAVLTLDTGALGTILDRTRPVAQSLPDLKRDGFQTGVSGAREPIFRSAPTAVDFGAGARQLVLRVGPPQGGCGADGLLGMDAIRGCVVAMSARGVQISCDPSARPAPSPQ